MAEISVRSADLSDLETLLKFEQGMIEAERPFDSAIRGGNDVRYYDLGQMIASPDLKLVVAEIDGEIIGAGYARIDDSKPYHKHRQHSYLGFMYVVPQHRGKGVNKYIIEALESWSVSRGVTQMVLEVYLENAAAVRAYEKSGYSTSLIEMRKSLSRE